MMRFLLVPPEPEPRALYLGQVGRGRGRDHHWGDRLARASDPLASSPSSHLRPAATRATASRSTTS